MTTTSRLGLIIAPHQKSDEDARFRLSRSLHKRLADLGVPWPIQIADSVDVAAVPNLFSIGTLTKVDIGVAGTWDGSAAEGSKFTDDTTDVNDAGAGDALVLPATEEDELDWLHLAFSGLTFGINTVIGTAGTDGAGTWEYLAQNGTWKTLSEVIDGSTGFTAGTSNYDTLWEIPNDWVPMIEDEVSASAYYHARFRVTTVYTINPVLTQIQAYSVDATKVAAGLVAPATGVIDYINYACTAGEGDNDTIIQIINHTRKTRGLVTLESDVARARVALSTQLFVTRGDELTMHPVQLEGSSELVNFTGFSFEISQ